MQPSDRFKIFVLHFPRLFLLTKVPHLMQQQQKQQQQPAATTTTTPAAEARKIASETTTTLIRLIGRVVLNIGDLTSLKANLLKPIQV